VPDLNPLPNPPYVFLTVGVISISGGAFFAYTGKGFGSFERLGLPRKQTESVLGKGRSVFSRWCFGWSDISCIRFSDFRTEVMKATAGGKHHADIHQRFAIKSR